jgi:hypothetical protein
MTLREIFEKAKQHLLEQGCRSWTETGCKYRGPEEKKCAVGIFIPDEDYRPRFENKLVSNLLDPSSLSYCAGLERTIGPINNDKVRLLCRLQEIHDTYPPSAWSTCLDELDWWVQKRET